MRRTFAFVALLGVLLALFGCGNVETKEARHEMTRTPYGYWIGGPNNSQVLNIEAAGVMSFETNGQQAQYTYTLDEPSQTMKVDVNGETQDWKFERNMLEMKITFPNSPEPVVFQMQ
ncbi:MAG: hypothetical protein ACK4XJ_03975 [Fimbriimonadaceae bacterium]